MIKITTAQLNEVLSGCPLPWFIGQPTAFHREIGELITVGLIDAARAKIRAKHRRDVSITIEPNRIVGMLSSRGLSISTEYGDFTVKTFRSDAKYLILYIQDGQIVTKSLTNSIEGVRSSFNFRKSSHPNAVPMVFDLYFKHDYEPALSAWSDSSIDA